MLSVKQAVDAGRTQLAELFPDLASSLRLEEIERYGTRWAITFSMTGGTILGGPFGVGRVAKVIEVDGDSGEFVSVKQRAA